MQNTPCAAATVSHLPSMSHDPPRRALGHLAWQLLPGARTADDRVACAWALEQRCEERRTRHATADASSRRGGSLPPKKCRRLVGASDVLGFTMSLTRLVACVEEAVDGKRAVHTLCPYKRSLTGRWSVCFRLNLVENEGNGIDCCSWRTEDFESRHHERGSPSSSQCVQNNDDATGSRTSSSAP